MQALTLKNIQFTCINRYSVIQLWLAWDINIMHDIMYFPFRSYGKFTAFTLKFIWPDYVVTDCRITPNRPCVFAIVKLDINVHRVVVSDDSSTAEIRRLLSAVLRLSSNYQCPRSKTRIASRASSLKTSLSKTIFIRLCLIRYKKAKEKRFFIFEKVMMLARYKP